MTTRRTIAEALPRAGAEVTSPRKVGGLRRSVTAQASGLPSPPPAGETFGHTFRDALLIERALTHRSLAYERGDVNADPSADNEQLEFIGDAVLGLIVAEALYRRFPGSGEGDLTRLRASLVSSRNLAQVAETMGLGPMLLMGRGERQSGGQSKPALLANALEAVIAAHYLDGGLEVARAFVQRHIIDPAEPGLFEITQSVEPFAGAVGDYKSALQERLQATGAGQPKYVLADQSGPDHQKRFRIEVGISDPDRGFILLASAEDTTKKRAQQEAARLAFAGIVSGSLAELLPRGNGASPEAGR